MHVNDLLNDQRPLLASSQDFPLDSRGTLRALFAVLVKNTRRRTTLAEGLISLSKAAELLRLPVSRSTDRPTIAALQTRNGQFPKSGCIPPWP